METTTISSPATGFLPEMLTTQQAAALVNVTTATILNWIKADAIPYVQLPGGSERAQYRVPLGGLISSLSGTYDLGAAIREAEEHVRTAGLSGDDVKRIAVEATENS
jgi:excisionase family DNA binding protein